MDKIKRQGMVLVRNAELRRQAEEIARDKAAQSSEVLEALSPEETWQMLHELRVHQIELKMQNEELRRAQQELETSRTRYFDLYDLAPVGYLTLSEKGLILEANLTAAGLLGRERGALVKQPFTRFILKEDQDLFYRYRKQLLGTGAQQTYQLRMVKKDKTVFWVRIEAATVQDPKGPLVFRVVISDITELKRIEEKLREGEACYRRQVLAAQENERKRIALEIHDSLGSNLAAIKFKVEEALLRFPKDDISKSLEALTPLIKYSIAEARRIQIDLRPPLLDDLGIVVTLSWLCRTFETIYSGIKAELAVSILEKDVPDQIKIALFRTAQEAMNNIGKHAKAKAMHLVLRKVDDTIELCIRDNGEGFDPKSLSSSENSKKGLGLTSMKERVEFSGGSFSIESAIGKGTVIRADWPV